MADKIYVDDKYSGGTLYYGGRIVLRKYVLMAGCDMRAMGEASRKVRTEMRVEGCPIPDDAPYACKTHGGSRGVGLRLATDGARDSHWRFAGAFCEEWVKNHPQEWTEFLDEFRARNYESVYPDLRD